MTENPNTTCGFVALIGAPNAGKATLLNFIQVLRTLGRTQHLLLLFPSALPPRQPTVQGKIETLKGKVALERMRRGD